MVPYTDIQEGRMKTIHRMPCILLSIVLLLQIASVGATVSCFAQAQDPSQLTPLPPPPKPVLPSVPLPPAPLPQGNQGAINPRTGEYYPPSGKGVINPKTGEYYPPSNSGYINPRTGEFYPQK